MNHPENFDWWFINYLRQSLEKIESTMHKVHRIIPVGLALTYSTLIRCEATPQLPDRRNSDSSAISIPIRAAHKDSTGTILPTRHISKFDDAHWEEKSKKCSFCKYMLQSPCSSLFKKWDSCVERAKLGGQDWENTCVDSLLLSCMEENQEYFNRK